MTKRVILRQKLQTVILALLMAANVKASLVTVQLSLPEDMLRHCQARAEALEISLDESVVIALRLAQGVDELVIQGGGKSPLWHVQTEVSEEKE